MVARSTRGARGARRLALVVSLALAPAAAGGSLLLADRSGEAEIGGLALEVEHVAWVHDAMDHGDRSAMPAAMAPDMPARGEARLAVEVKLSNRSASAQRFEPEELQLGAGDGRAWSPSMTDVDTVSLRSNQALSTRISFDVPEEAPGLRLWWNRGASRALLGDVKPARHPAEAVNAPPVWPRSTDALPPGDAASGERLFTTTLGCASCHGRLEAPLSATLGPDLARIAGVGATRVERVGAAEYVYQSLLDPSAVIAPSCAGGRPCAKPSAMPPYGERMSLQEMADVIAYLLSFAPR